MKILHTADTHIGTFPGPTEQGKNLRLEDTIQCMQALAESARSEDPDLILISGDLFHRARLWADEMLVEIQAAVDWLNGLSYVAPVCLLYGTPNHDNEEAFKTISLAVNSNVHIFMRPECRVIHTKSGPVQVCALPGFDRGYFRAKNPGVSREDENATFSSALSQIVMGLRAECNKEIPAVLMAHYTVPGADMESGQVQMFSQAEPMLTTDTLLAADFDLVALGHIHKPQQLSSYRKAFYSGAINRLNFNDEGQKRGFWYHKLSHFDITSDFVEMPTRKFHTIKLGHEEIESINQHGPLELLDAIQPEFDNAIVRVLYSCSDEQEKALNKGELERVLYKLGAFWVKEISPEEISVTVDRKAMDEAATPEDNLVSYLQEHGFDAKRIEAALELAQPIIASAIASVRDKRSSGILRPISIEVANYRNYREATFDFTDISMCTINGVNGAGKSSLFMDAIVDCLYEEPREDDLTGWIRADDDARSGAITFTFSIGDHLYRVSRTRARSGKATLNLSECVESTWQNRSCERFRDTQDEITALLGMDISTFKSCALIMQDQYGIFLEAGKEQRMVTLAEMLGLGIYDGMEETARDKATDVSRSIRSLQDQEDRLGDDLRREGPALDAQAQATADIECISVKINEERIHEGETRLSVNRARDAVGRISTLSRELESKQTALLQAERQHNAALAEMEKLAKILGSEANILEKAAQYDYERSTVERLTAEQLTAQREYDAVQHAASRQERITTELHAKSARMELITNEYKAAEKTIIDLGAYKDSAAQRDDTALKITEWERSLSEQEHLTEVWRKASIRLTTCTQELQHALTVKETEVNTLRQRAALLLDSKCIDPDNAKCVFLADAIRSRDTLPALENALVKMRAQAEEELAGLRETEASTKLESSRAHLNPEVLAQLRLEHQRHASNATKYEQRTIYLDRVAALSRELADLTDELNGLYTEHQKAQDAAAECESKKTQLDNVIRERAGAAYMVQQLQVYAYQAKALPDMHIQLDQAAEREKQFSTMVEENNLSKAQIEKEIESLRVEAIKLAGMEYRLAGITTQISELDRLKGEANVRLGAANKVLEIVETAKQQIASLRCQINALADTAALYTDLKQAFSKDGIPHNIIRSVIPVLESTSNNILAQMTGGKMCLEFVTERALKSNAKKEITTLDIFIQESGRSRLPYLSKSGGEKVKVSLSVVLALAEIMSRRAGIQLGFLFVDEPPFLDDLGTQAYCDALDAIRVRYPGHVVMAITHDPTMKARFPQSIDVERTEEGSQIVYA